MKLQTGFGDAAAHLEEAAPHSGGGVGRRPLRVLCMTTLYPNEVEPRHGIFVESRLRKLCSAASVQAEVVAPIPWFPSRWAAFGRYAKFARIPRWEMRHSLTLHHPRYLMIPKVGMSLQPFAIAQSVLRDFRRKLLDANSFDVVDAHYFYPDGVAAAYVARKLGLPLVITARGSDINLIAQMRGPRAAILRAAEQASAVIAVSDALRIALCEVGVDPAKITVLRNGVDREVFRPDGRAVARDRLGVSDQKLVLAVGNLVPEKGHDLVIGAVARLPSARLLVIGQGPERARLQGLAEQFGVGQRVQFLSNMPQADLASVYAAADVLALGSEREGWPNVLLEAMACGTPVVATDVGGVREVVRDEIAGLVVRERSPAAMASAIEHVLARPRQEALRTSYAAAFDWESIASRYFAVLATAAGLQRQLGPETAGEGLEVSSGLMREKATY